MSCKLFFKKPEHNEEKEISSEDEISSNDEEIDDDDVISERLDPTKDAPQSDAEETAAIIKGQEIFAALKADNEHVSTDSLCHYLVDEGAVELGEVDFKDFIFSMEYYLKMVNPEVTCDSITQQDFVQFWSNLASIFEGKVIDEDGDRNLSIVECVKFLERQARKCGLVDIDDLFTRVSELFKIADANDDAKISFVEFLIQLPKLESFFRKQYFDIEN